MPNINETEAAPRKELHVFYVLDTSGSMEGDKISTLNHAMEETRVALAEVAKKNADARLKIAVMEYNSNCRWVTNYGPEDMENFEWDYLEAGGLTAMDRALDELNDKLSTHTWLKSMMGALMPIIIFMTDGYATCQDEQLAKSLERIRKNRWFARATKIGFAFGDDADVSQVASIVGNSEAVLKTTDLETFKKLLVLVSVTSSMLVSQSQTPEQATTGEDIVRRVLVNDGDAQAGQVHLDPDDYDPEPAPTPQAAPDSWPDDGEW